MQRRWTQMNTDVCLCLFYLCFKIMNTFVNLLISVIIAGWVLAIALISVQNATPVSLRFLVFQSIPIPVGLVLAFFVAVGLVGVAVLQPLLAGREFESGVDDEAEFFIDDEDFY